MLEGGGFGLPVGLHGASPRADHPIGSRRRVIADLAEEECGITWIQPGVDNQRVGNLPMLHHVERFARRIMEEGEEFSFPEFRHNARSF